MKNIDFTQYVSYAFISSTSAGVVATTAY